MWKVKTKMKDSKDDGIITGGSLFGYEIIIHCDDTNHTSHHIVYFKPNEVIFLNIYSNQLPSSYHTI